MIDSEKFVDTLENFVDDLKQQKLPSYQFSFGPIFVFTLTFFLGFLCIGLGVLLTSAASSIQEIVIDYTNETSATVELSVNLTQFQDDVFVYYQLEGFPQLHYSMRHSYDFEHFGEAKYDSSICTGSTYAQKVTREYWENLKTMGWFHRRILDVMVLKTRDPTSDIPVPCGERAKFFFNDEIAILDANSNLVNFTNKNIIWDAHRAYFKNNETYNATGYPCATFENGTTGDPYDKPKPWTKHICDMENAMENEDFIAWMVPAYAMTFRKLWRKFIRIEQVNGSKYFEGLAHQRENYTIEITNIWPNWNISIENVTIPVRDLEIFRKKIVISTTNWAGGKGTFLGYAYLIVGAIILFIGCGLAIMQSFRPSYLIRETEEHIRWRKNN